MAVCGSCDARDGERIRSRELSRTGLARVCGGSSVVRWVGRRRCRQAGSGMARSRAKARLNFSAQGQRFGRCRVNRRAERVSRPGQGGRTAAGGSWWWLSALPDRSAPSSGPGCGPSFGWPARRRWRRSGPRGDGSGRRRSLRSRMAFSISAWRRWSASSSSNSPSRSVMKP